MENPFLHKKYPELQQSEEVDSAVKRKEIRSEEKVSQKPTERIQVYLDRFKELVEDRSQPERDRGLEALKKVLEKKFIIQPENVTESVFLLEQKIARQLGHGDVEITEEFKQRKIQQIIGDQKTSLEAWIDYLASEDALYPDWAKYWVLRSVLSMGKLEKKEEKDGKIKARFGKRDKNTAAPFPPKNPRALAKTIEVLEDELKRSQLPKKERGVRENKSTKLGTEEFNQLLSSKDFSKIYAQFLVEIPAYSKEGLRETRGEWKKYPQGSAAEPLVQSLEGYPLEWCTAALDTAKTQLEGGDFYVYYSLDDDGEAKIPRAAIRMQGNEIAEVRGIAPDQNVDPYIAPVIAEKMQDFPDGEKYEKKTADMARMTEIEEREKQGGELTKEDLRFLYEIDGKIEGFGYGRDPRINELLQERDKREDLAFALNCRPEQISFTKEEALSGDIVFHYGGLYLNSLTSAEGLTLPQSIGGSLDLNSLTSAEGLTLPQSIGGSLDLSSLTSAEREDLRRKYPELKYRIFPRD